MMKVTYTEKDEMTGREELHTQDVDYYIYDLFENSKGIEEKIKRVEEILRLLMFKAVELEPELLKEFSAVFNTKHDNHEIIENDKFSNVTLKLTENVHPWYNTEGWTTNTYTATSEREMVEFVEHMHKDGWKTWILSNDGSFSFVLYREDK